MKACKFLVFLLLAVALTVGSAQVSAEAGLLGRVSQILNLYYDGTAWTRIMPDGTILPFALAPGQSMVMTELFARFYATNPNSGPYRLFLKGPNGGILWIENLSDLMYPTTGSTVWGGGLSTSYDGIHMSVVPIFEVRQLPVPPNDPNNGPIRTGTMYIRIHGYLLP